MASSSTAYQLLFSGLPLDVQEKDLRDLLLAAPMSLPATTTSVKSFLSSEGRPLGVALIQVGNDVDAERIRREYSGQVIDDTYRLSVQHILPPTQPLPSKSVQPFITTKSAPTPVVAAPQSGRNSRVNPSGPSNTNGKGKAPTPPSNKPPGLQLLSRLSKPGPPGSKERQAALIAQQKANIKLASSQPGKALLNRLGKSGKPAPQLSRKASGQEKVNRAKARATATKMEIDAPTRQTATKQTAAPKPAAPAKATPKSQADLDEEMRVWERQRRFAA